MNSTCLRPPKPARTNRFDFGIGAGRRGVVEKAYLHGELKGGTRKGTAQDLSEGYTKAANAVAEKQAALTGYRLADEIGRWVR